LVVLGLLWPWYKAFAISLVHIPPSGNGFRLTFGAVTKVGMIDALEVKAVATVDRAVDSGWF